MDKGSKKRGRSIPDALSLKPIAFNLEEALAVEKLYRPNLLAINQNEHKLGDVTLHDRDAAVDILRFLRFWFDYSHTVFFTAVSYLDMFLAKMKVQEKYLKCVTVSCFYLASQSESLEINTDHLVKISQSNCQVSDMLRMAGIIQAKIKTEQKSNEKVTTAVEFLKLYLKVFGCFTHHLDKKIFTKDFLQIEELLIRLEVILSDSSTAFFRSSAIALVLIQIEIEKIMAMTIPNKSLYVLGEMLHLLTVLRELQHTCKIRTAELKNSHASISKILKQYDSQTKNKHCQELKWKFSASTMEKSHKHRDFQMFYATIKE